MRTLHYIVIIISIVVLGSSSMVFAQIGNPWILGLQSPLKQFKSGIHAQDVKCQPYYFTLVLKGSNNSPACIKNSDVVHFFERSWAIRTIKVENSDQSINYAVAGGSVTTSKMDIQSKSLMISINTRTNGTLIITIPRALLDTVKNQRGEGQFIMFADGQEASFNQIHTTMLNRTFSIPFQNGTSQIEIIATELI